MRTNYEKLLTKVRELGMDYKWAEMFVDKLRDDEIAFPVIDEGLKKWALEKGFYPGRVELYGLDDNNWKNYIPDYQYFMLHPINNHFLKWLDKTTLKYVLNSNHCEDTMPDYYVYVENEKCGGRFTYLMDCPNDIHKGEDFLWHLLQKERILALKPNSGTSGGLGFIKLEINDGSILENNKIINAERFREIRDSMRNYIVTEYIHQHNDLAAVWPNSECTLRVIMVKNNGLNRYAEPTWHCAVSYARFGTSISGGASNLCSGGVGIGFDFDSGKYCDFAIQYKRFCHEGQWKIEKHPDTGYCWRGRYLPNWQITKQKIYSVCNQVASLDYLGLDVIITNDGMKICEINSHPAIDYEQVMCGPTILADNIKEFFYNKGIEDYDAKDFYRAYCDSQE